MKRYWIANGVLTPSECGNLVCLGDAQATVEALRAQLPATMQECAILFKACEKGHGRLTATNWVNHGCQTCVVEALQRERDTARRRVDELEAREVDVDLLRQELDAEREKLVAVAKERDLQCTLKHNCIGMLEREREKVKDLEAAAGAMSCKEIADKVAGYMQLQSLVRAFFTTLASNDQEAYRRAYVALKRTMGATTPVKVLKPSNFSEISSSTKGGDGE